MKKLIWSIILSFSFLFLTGSQISASGYFLPYPSFMPGHKLYRIHQAWEKIQEYWYFGSIAKFKFHLQMADKYLVEAKTLFEYQQFLLATKALEKSSHHLEKASPYLEKAEKERKDVSQKKKILASACQKHREVLTKLLDEVPAEFFWQEEKEEGQKLALRKIIEEAITKIPNF